MQYNMSNVFLGKEFSSKGDCLYHLLNQFPTLYHVHKNLPHWDRTLTRVGISRLEVRIGFGDHPVSYPMRTVVRRQE
jgi:hypothetical protein